MVSSCEYLFNGGAFTTVQLGKAVGLLDARKAQLAVLVTSADEHVAELACGKGVEVSS